MSDEQHDLEDFTERRLQRLELRYRRAHLVLAGARAVYESLREMPRCDAVRLEQARQRLERAQQQISDIQHTIEGLEDRQDVA